jgi:hypothetical protein
MTPTESTVRARVLETHRETLRSLIDVGRGVATTWSGRAVTQASAVRDPLEDAIDERGLSDALLDALRVGVAALDERPQGRLLPAPPYLVVTSRGPLCRTTMSDDRRLVLLVELFEVDRAASAYRFVDPTPEDCLTVRIE